MNHTGKCQHCKRKFTQCKFNGDRHRFCLKDECRSASRKLSKARYRKNAREAHLTELADLEAQLAEKRQQRTSNKLPEIPSSTAPFDAMGDIAKMWGTSLSSIVHIFQGLAVKMACFDEDQNVGDIASSFIMECYEVGRSLFLTSDTNNPLKEFLYAPQRSYSSTSFTADPTKIQLARPSPGS